jgi:hypothetical protein
MGNGLRIAGVHGREHDRLLIPPDERKLLKRAADTSWVENGVLSEPPKRSIEDGQCLANRLFENAKR